MSLPCTLSETLSETLPCTLSESRLCTLSETLYTPICAYAIYWPTMFGS